ncbi:MAG: deoxyribose-phosphate aldolase [Planctomycetota bacterium]
MELTATQLAQKIDVSAVQTRHSEPEIRLIAEQARKRGFAAVHVLPCWIPLLRDLLAGQDRTLVGGPAGFPSGAHRTEVKVAEARWLVADGAQEIDLMINVGMLRAGRNEYVEEEIRRVVGAVGGVPVKVILEVAYLEADEIRRACDLSITGGAAFVKTATGWAPSGATLEVVKLITDHVGGAIQVKAAGGIRDLETVRAMLRMGVARFGINLQASLDLIQAVEGVRGGVLEL